MKKIILAITLSITEAMSILPTLGDITFNATFENPPHVLNSAVAVGTGDDSPAFSAGSVITRTGIADFSTQVASFEPAGQLSFFSPTPTSSGLLLITWDMAMIEYGPGGLDTAAVSIQNSPSGGGALTMFWKTDNSFRIGGTTAGAYTLGQQDNYAFLFDLDNDSYDFLLNGSPLMTNQALAGSFDVQNVVFAAENLRAPTYAIDNFRWEVIPEPSTIGLMGLGLAGLLLRKTNIANRVTNTVNGVDTNRK